MSKKRTGIVTKKEKVDVSILYKDNRIVMICGDLTALQRKSYNILLQNSRKMLKSDRKNTVHRINCAELRKMSGCNQTNDKEFVKQLRALRKISVSCDYANGDVKWCDFSLISQITKFPFEYEYELPPIIRDALVNSVSYTPVDLIPFKELSGKHAIQLYEIALRYSKVSIPEFSLDEFKKLFGVTSYKAFRDLRIRVIEPAIAEINSVTNLGLRVEYLYSGREVTGLRFYVLDDKAYFLSLNPEAFTSFRDVKKYFPAAYCTDEALSVIEDIHASKGVDYAGIVSGFQMFVGNGKDFHEEIKSRLKKG